MKEVSMIDKENLMISYNSEDNSDGCFPLVNNMISWASKEQICVPLYSDEDEYTTKESHCKKLL